MEDINLPELTEQQDNFVKRYIINGENASEAYRFAYNAEKSNKNTVWKEASKVLNDPKVTPWIRYRKANLEKVVEEELNFSAKKAISEADEVIMMALDGQGKYGDPNLNAVLKAIEIKSRIAGLFKEKIALETDEKVTLFISKAQEKAKKLEEKISGEE